MDREDLLNRLKNGLIVSCQALENEPLHGSDIMAKVALAAKLGGAVGIRANTIQDIIAIKKEIDLPIIGIIKKDYNDSDIYITPTLEEVQALYEEGVEILATDCTDRARPNGQALEVFFREIKKRFTNQIIMADISTLEEGIKAEKLGADIISTTLSGYTPYSTKVEGPDFELIKNLVKTVKVPVFAEGRIHNPEQAKTALEYGAHSIVVGGAITRPLEITKRFVNTIGSQD